MKTDNEVIADFIGKRLPGEPQQWDLPMCDGYYPSSKTLEFDKRWERLMPVWYKFKELKYPVPSSLSSGQFYGLFLDYQGQIIRAIIHKGPSPAEACKLLAEGI